jgi:hypothetical protein
MCQDDFDSSRCANGRAVCLGLQDSKRVLWVGRGVLERLFLRGYLSFVLFAHVVELCYAMLCYAMLCYAIESDAGQPALTLLTRNSFVRLLC